MPNIPFKNNYHAAGHVPLMPKDILASISHRLTIFYAAAWAEVSPSDWGNRPPPEGVSFYAASVLDRFHFMQPHGSGCNFYAEWGRSNFVILDS